MGNLLLNSPAFHHSRAFRDLKKEHPGQVNLLVGQNNSGEMVMRISKQPAHTKKVLSKMLAICSLSGPGEQKGHQASNRHQIQKNSEQNARYLLTIMTRTRYCHFSCEI